MDFNFLLPPIGDRIQEDLQSLQDDLVNGAEESVRLDLRGTNCYGIERAIDVEDQQTFFAALAQNAKLPHPTQPGDEVRPIRHLQLLLTPDDFHKTSPQARFDSSIMRTYLAEFFQHVRSLESLEVFFDGTHKDSISDCVWTPLSVNERVRETLKFLSVVGGNQAGLRAALPKFQRLEELWVFDWTNEITQKHQFGAVRYGGPERLRSGEAKPLGDDTLATIQEFLHAGPENLHTLTVTPAVLHSLRDAIAASAAPIYRIRIWGIFEDRPQNLQYRDATFQYYEEHKRKNARTAEKPDLTVYQQALLDLKYIVANKASADDQPPLFDVWFMFGGFTTDEEPTLLDDFLRIENLPMLEKIAFARFSATKTLALQNGNSHTVSEFNVLPLPWQGEAAVAAARRLREHFGSEPALPLKLDLFGGDMPLKYAWATSPELAATMLVDPASSPLRRENGPDRGFSDVE
ncbi:unnamed protein product [Amoebophrya sp. A120]|nr:unnamed protein product [Amoebophrya sp. A120]|eukprot:GSA120T00014642001.1